MTVAQINIFPDGAGMADTLALGLHDLAEIARDPDAPVIHDDQGVPVAWRLFAFGPFEITRNGQTMRGEFTPAAADAIIAYYAQKGGKIPLDSRHFLFRLAEKLGVPEEQVATLLPDGRGTFGYAALEKRGDGLWVADVEYVPLAYRLMAEGVFRYFSPVVRGLSDGRLRITSVAFTNEPAIDRLESLAAEAEEPAIGSMDALAASLDSVALSAHAHSKDTKDTKEPEMEKLMTALASLLGMDSIALSDDNAPPEDVVAKITDLAGEITDLRAARDERKTFLAAVSDTLALSEDADLKTAQADIEGLKASAGQAGDLKTRLDAVELEAETRKRAEVIERGMEEGKLTNDMVEGDWCKGQDAAALEAYLATAPVIVPMDRVKREALKQPDAVALSDDDREILSMVGVTEPEDQEAAAKL